MSIIQTSGPVKNHKKLAMGEAVKVIGPNADEELSEAVKGEAEERAEMGK